jgi:hypothetical protein
MLHKLDTSLDTEQDNLQLVVRHSMIMSSILYSLTVVWIGKCYHNHIEGRP